MHKKPVAFVLLQVFLVSLLRADLSYGEAYDLLRPKASSQDGNAKVLQTALSVPFVPTQNVAQDGSDRQSHPVTLDDPLEEILKREWERAFQEGLRFEDRDRRPIAYDPRTLESRPLGPYRAIFMPGKTGALQWRTPRQTDILQVVEPVHPDAFNFTKTDPEQYLFTLAIGNRRYHAYPNKYPLYPYHVLLSVDDLRPQLLTEEDVRNAVRIASQTPLKLFFNSWRAGASINHFHLQGSFEDFPLSHFAWRPLERIGNVTLGRLLDYPESNIVFESDDSESLTRMSFLFIEELTQKNIPHSAFFTKGRILVTPRTNELERDKAYSAEMVRLRLYPYLGIAAVVERQAYESLTEEAFENLLASRSLQASTHLSIVRGFIDRARRIASDGGEHQALGEFFDAQLRGKPLDLRNPLDMDAVKKRGIAAIVLLGGEGKRMKPALKQTFPFLGKPMGLWPILALKEANIPTVVVVGYQKEKVVEAFERVLPGITYVGEVPPFRGVGQGVLYGLKALPGYDGPVLVINGDAAAADRSVMQHMETATRETGQDVVLMVYEKENSHGLGRIVRSEKGKVLSVVEQSKIDERRTITFHDGTFRPEELQKITLVNAGLYGFRHAKTLRKAIRQLRPFRTDPIEYGLPEVIEKGLGAMVTTLPKGEEYKLFQPNDRLETAQFEQYLRERHARPYSQDGGRKQDHVKGRNYLGVLLGDAQERWRNQWLTWRLRRQRVELHGSLIGKTISIGPEVDIREFRNGVIEAGTRVTGKSKIGARAHLSGYIQDSVIGRRVKIHRGKEIIDSTIGNGSVLTGASIRQYDIEERVKVTDSNLSMDGESTFGNGVEIRIGPEKEGGRTLLIYDGLTVGEAWEVVSRRNESDRAFQDAYRAKVLEYAASVKSDRGRVEEGAVIAYTNIIKNARIGTYARVVNASEVVDATILSSRRHQTLVNSETKLLNAIVQAGVIMGEGARAQDTIMMAHSGASDGIKIENSLLGPHSVMGFGHVVSSFIGPFVNKHHPDPTQGSILIAVLWPEGRGNIGGLHTGSNHSTRGPTEEAFYPLLGFFGTSTTLIYPFYGATGLIVGTHLTVPSQKIDFPFSILTTPSFSMNPRLNEILPGGVLYTTPYYLERAEYNHEEINRREGTDFETRVFTSKVVAEMVEAKGRLEQKPVSGKPRTKHAVYTEKDYPGLGKNVMTEASRNKAIQAYEAHISYYALKALREKVGEVLRGNVRDWTDLRGKLTEEGIDKEWDFARSLLEERFGKAEGWSKEFVLKLFRKKLRDIERRYYDGVLGSKRKDEERRLGIFAALGEVHIPMSKLPPVIALRERMSRAVTETNALRLNLLELPGGEEPSSHASDGGRRLREFQLQRSFIESGV